MTNKEFFKELALKSKNATGKYPVFIGSKSDVELYNIALSEIKNENFNNKKPPIGLMPHKFWVEERIQNILDAIDRYIQADMKIPIEWIEEYNKLKGE